MKITEHEKRRLISSFIKLDIKGLISYDWDERLDIEQEMIDIYIERIKKGSSKYRAYIDTIDDMLIKYQMPSKRIDKNFADKARDSTKLKYYSVWCVSISTIIAAQSLFLFGSAITNFSLLQILESQAVFIGINLALFFCIFIIISKDKNYDTDDELRSFCKYQLEIFMIIILSPLLMFIEILRPSARKR